MPITEPDGSIRRLWSPNRDVLDSTVQIAIVAFRQAWDRVNAVMGWDNGKIAQDWADDLNEIEGRILLASAGDDRTVRLWDPALGTPGRVLKGHTGRVYVVCAVSVDGRTVLVSGGDDGTVRLWNPATALVVAIPINQTVQACINLDNQLIIGTVRGILSLTISTSIIQPDNRLQH